MKKYLMTGIAALALCVGFTSCSHDLEPMSQEEIDQMEAQKVVNTYKAAFEQYIGGKVAANQTWGFSGTFAARTRNNGIDNAINVNGNMWNPEDVPAVDITSTPTEVQAIYDYVKYTLPEMDRLGHVYATEVTDILDGYYVTQVRNGKNSDNQDPAANGTTITNEGGYMNHLQIAFNQNPTMDDLANLSDQNGWNAGNDSGWEHINNFNASDNYNHANAAQSPDHGNTKVEHKGAFDFAYHNSLDSKYHNNWILVDGYYITEDHKYKDFYYVCFDFESMPDGVKTQFSFSGLNDSNQMQSGYNGDVDGYYSSVAEIKAAWEKAGTTKFTGKDGKERNISEMDNITITGYEKGDKVVFPDDIHTDWIIRITKGAREIEKNADLRVMAEDLTNGSTDEDFDFNDIVFDVYFGAANTAKVVVKAAGGTLDLRIARVENPTTDADWSEVHGLFASVNPGVNCANKMINTHGTDADQSANVQRQSLDGLTCPEFTLPFAVTTNADAKKIKIQVKKGGNWVEITSEQGEPAAKFAVPHTYGWMKERTSIKAVNETFTTWCQGESELIWVGGINE